MLGVGFPASAMAADTASVTPAEAPRMLIQLLSILNEVLLANNKQ